MAKPTTIAGNVMDQFEQIAGDAWKNTEKAVKTVAKDVSSQTSWSSTMGLPEPLSDEALEQQEDESLMTSFDGYKQRVLELNEMRGIATDEQTLDQELQNEIAKKRKELHESFQRFKRYTKDIADEYGKIKPDVEASEKQREKQIEAQKKTREDEEKKRAMETPPVSQSKKSGGRSRMSKRGNIALEYAKTKTEQRAGHGAGG